MKRSLVWLALGIGVLLWWAAVGSAIAWLWPGGVP